METKKTIWQPKFIVRAVYDSFIKLNPLNMYRNPVMFAVEIGSILTALITVYNIIQGHPFGFNLQISLWLWFTVLFANFAEALAEGKGKAQAESLKQARSDIIAQKLLPNGDIESIPALALRKGDIALASDNHIIPSDGEIIEGVALVDESAITGESAPVVREFGGDKTGVTGGTKVLSGNIKIKITVNPGETFLDQMVGMIESAKRQKTPNEKALEILLVGLTVLFFVVVVTLNFYAGYVNVKISIPILVALLVCLMPTTIGGLLPAIGIAGMDRLMSRNVIALSGRAVEAAGDVNIVLLDKTGTITLGNRIATEFIPAPGVEEKQLARAAMLSSLADETPEGRSVVILAKEKLRMRGRDITAPEGSKFISFSAETRMSGVDINDRQIRKGATDAIKDFVKPYNKQFPKEVGYAVDRVGGEGGTPLVVCENGNVLGVVRLKDVLKHGIRERLSQLKNIGITSVMITGDNPTTAAAIAAEAGVSDFIAQARPETKLERIRKFQSEGYMVAMIGDGTNDAPALAQADVAVAMNAGTQAAREAANMVDLDSTPTKLLDIVEIGKQILITRGALTTFSVANDVAKYFAIIPALFAVQYPILNTLNVMRLSSPQSAILSAVIFNAIIIPFLIPLSLKGVQCKQDSPMSLLIRNLFIYGLGGLILPFIGIKLIDMIIH
ncbi:MAG TPA: potassium-transporting ATPase subunit KdpB [Candidatus Gastranaerophilales bacterium]|nr:potassium-transporting ATPase subunit KdpB [Candidatus Gastranaerophilales bacterium]